MRILFTGDNHFDSVFGETRTLFFKAMQEFSPDITVNLGDMTNGWLQAKNEILHAKQPGLKNMLDNPLCLYVLGNHDIWNHRVRQQIKPDAAFVQAIRKLASFPARPLEKSFTDCETSIEFPEQKCVFVGTMGFPDFGHPIFVMPKEYYDKRSCTNDSTYMNLMGGWLQYTEVILDSFRQRLQKAVALNVEDIVVATHYPIFTGQYRLSGDDISAYFFCHAAGNIVKEIAEANPDKKFWCFAAHAHDYCRGTMVEETSNVLSYGLQADYRRLTFAGIDTSLGFSGEPKVFWADEAPRWSIGWKGTIIETR